MLNPEISL